MSNRNLTQLRRDADAHAATLDNARKAAPETWALYEELLVLTPAESNRREYETVLFSLGEAAARGYHLTESDVLRVRSLMASLK